MHIQYCNGDTDITGDFYAEDDATIVRIWDDDAPLVELVPDAGQWRVVWANMSIGSICDADIFDTPHEVVDALAREYEFDCA